MNADVKIENEIRAKIDQIIEAEDYEGIRDQDGWETLYLTVTEKYPKEATQILQVLQQTQSIEKERPKCSNCKHGCKFVTTCKFYEAI